MASLLFDLMNIRLLCQLAMQFLNITFNIYMYVTADREAYVDHNSPCCE